MLQSNDRLYGIEQILESLAQQTVQRQAFVEMLGLQQESRNILQELVQLRRQERRNDGE